MFIKSVFSQQSTAEGTTRKTVTVAFGGRMSLVVLKSSGSGGGGGGGGGPVPVDKHAWRHAKKGPDAVTPKSIGAHLEGGSDDLDFRAGELSAKNTATDNLLALQADIQQADIQQAYIKKVIAPEIVSPEYIGGALGQGFRYYIDENGNSVMVLDKLRVMKEATFNVLTISELRSVGGQILLTYADARVEAVVEKQSAWRCYYDSGEGGQYWVVGDQARCQKFTGASGDTLKYYWRLVTAVGGEELGGKMLQWIELSKEVVDGEGVPQVGDECVGLGHRGEDRRRKNAKLISAFGENGVEEISYANIDGFSLVGKETAYQSPEKWRVRSNAFELVAGNGIVYPTVVERGAWRLADAPYYYYDRVSHGGNIYLCIDKRLDGTMVEPATDQHAVWLCEVRKGDQGLPGVVGPQGVPGMPGKDGLPTYTWIRYADTAAGVGMSNDPTGKIYIGFAYNKTTATESNTPGDYMWSLIKGGDGVKGEDGSDGQTTYTWIKYADNADGTGLYDLPKTTTKYIGIATNKTTATESSLKTDYIWSQFKGDTGAAAPRLKTQFSINGTTAWHDAYAVGDAYRRESNDDGITWSSAMRMVGEGGTPGADGKKTPYTDFSYAYGLSQPTVWLDAPPTKVEGQHLWERIQKYTPKADNSGWTLASTSYAIINEFVQIGGRNYLLNSNFSIKDTDTYRVSSPDDIYANIYSLDWVGGKLVVKGSAPADGNQNKRVLLFTQGALPAGNYVLSMEVSSSVDATVSSRFFWAASPPPKEATCVVSGVKKRIVLFLRNEVSTVPSTYNSSVASIWFDQIGTFTIDNIKLEKGNKATDWSPAPEDVQAEIDKANAMLADMASDSKLTPTEKQQTALEWSRIKAEQAKNTAAATTAGVSTAEVTIAYNTLNGYLDTGANPLLKDLTTTSDIVGGTFRSTFATWYDKNASLVNATAEAVARNAADAVQIGGVNLVPNSKLFEFQTVTDLSKSLEVGKIYTLSIARSTQLAGSDTKMLVFNYTEGSASGGVQTYIDFGDDKNWTFEAIGNTLALYAGVIWSSGNWAKIEKLKLEKGNKATDWSPAPEDVQAEIDKANAMLADMASDSKLTPTEKQQTALEWSRIKAEQAKNTAAATTAGVSTAEVTIAYNTLNGYLETGANPLLKDLTTTSDIVGGTFRSTFATWYDKNATLVNATAEAVARNAADEIQVGGRNYALDTAGERRIIYWRPGSKFKLSPKIIDQEVDIIITFWEKDEESTTSTGIGWGSDTAWSGVYFWYSNTSPGKRQIKVKKPAGVSAIYYFKNSLSTTYDFSVQTGDKEMDWSPAPEDAQAEIDASKSVVYAISPSAEQVKKIVTTAANGVTATSLLPSTLSVSVTRKKGNEDATVVSSFAMKYFSNKGASAVIGAWPLDLGPIAKDWEWLDLVLYSDATYAKELARKRIHINENADISGAEIAARINASGSEVQIEGEKISVIGKMIQLNKMTVDVDGNATMNDVTMNNADISGKVTASSGSIGPLNVEPGKLNCGVLEISEITENSHDYDGVSPVYGRVGPFPVKGGGTVSGKWQSTEAIQLGRPNDVTLHFGLAAVMPQAGSYNVKVRFRAEDIRGNTKVTFPEFLGHGYYDFPRRFTLYGFPAGCYLVMEVTGDMTGQQLLPVTFRLSAMNDNMVPKLSSPYIYYSNGSTVIIDRSGTRIGYGSTIQYVGDGRISFIQRQNSGVFEFSINDVKLVLDKTKLIKLMNLIK